MAGDATKLIGPEPKVNYLLLGIPKAIQAFEENDQFASRACAPIYFFPYNWYQKKDRDEFAKIVKYYEGELLKAGAEIDISFNELVRGCYRMSGGCIRIISDFMILLTSELNDTLKLDRSLLNDVAEMKVQRFPSMPLFFSEEGISDEQLLRSYEDCLLQAELSSYALRSV